MSTLNVILMVMSTARITRLVTTDRLTEAPRDWVLDRVDPLGLITYMLGCPWCISIWVGMTLAPITYWFGSEPWVAIPALLLTASYVTGYLARDESEGDG